MSSDPSSGSGPAVASIATTADPSTAAYWDARYGAAGRLWSGRPNVRVVEHISALSPGSALDVGAGEGGDALWLAARGWRVTGLDISAVALLRAAEQAAAQGLPNIDWQCRDVLGWTPPAAAFDLVSVQYLHLSEPAQRDLHRLLTRAVRVGGRLLVVGHHPDEVPAARRFDPARWYPTAEQMAESLPCTTDGQWRVEVADAPAQTVADPHGTALTIRDAVLLAIRTA
ncbi:class I SAM-dependent methyltransferase [Nakamurella leprariae]|uniref:Class I SAM-dependent methyltransferase n=1 Tax=Nakamurella leprariae TaxID=2803911 RepID=A0A939BUZ7_9ACTN|nr:class I SAM-dependent methyltransferase [Nakamurella leprariae]MBM9466028.1 class I SAM-dependent methyltransferase [Nakamurella leprariae]